MTDGRRDPRRKKKPGGRRVNGVKPGLLSRAAPAVQFSPPHCAREIAQDTAYTADVHT